MTRPLYDIAYQSMKDAETLARAIRKMGAVLVDVRYKPSSRDHQWRKPYLVRLLGKQYRHMKSLGNRNYKSGPIRLDEPEMGVYDLLKVLEQVPVVIMCACWRRETCHRVKVIEIMEAMHGIESTPLKRSDINKFAGPDPTKPHQPELFGGPA